MGSLTQEQGFVWSLFLFQSICLLVFSIHFDTANLLSVKLADANSSRSDSSGRMTPYAIYMDIHVMIFIGFGFLMIYLRKYCLSAESLNFVVAVMSIQWGVIVVTMVGQVGDNDFPIKIIDVNTLIDGDFAAATMLVSFGTVLGKVTPTRLLWMTFFEVIFYAINAFILSEYLYTVDTGKSVVIHTFGAFFGLALTVRIGVPWPHEEAHNMSSFASDTFAMIGTIFLWTYWPSFNAAMAPSADFRQERAVVNTVLSIVASCAVTFATSQIVTREEVRHGACSERNTGRRRRDRSQLRSGDQPCHCSHYWSYGGHHVCPEVPVSFPKT